MNILNEKGEFLDRKLSSVNEYIKDELDVDLEDLHRPSSVLSSIKGGLDVVFRVLIAWYMYHRGLWSSDVIASVVKDLTELSEETASELVQKAQEGLLMETVFSEDDSEISYGAALTYAICSTGLKPAFLFLMYRALILGQSTQRSKQLYRLIEIEDLLLSTAKELYMKGLDTLLYNRIAEGYFPQEHRPEILELLLQDLDTEACKQTLLSFWLLNFYIGNQQFTEIFADHLEQTCSDAEEEMSRFAIQPQWSWLDDNQVASQVKKYVGYYTGTGIQKETGRVNRNRRSSLMQKGIRGLVPMIYHVRSKNEIAAEAFLLRFLLRKVPGDVLYGRVSEISGCPVPSSFPLDTEERGRWFDERGKVGISLDLAEEMYAVQPFDINTLRTFIVSGLTQDNGRLEKLFKRSIHRLSSGAYLRILLAEAIHKNSFFAVQLLVDRIIELELYNSALFAAQTVKKISRGPSVKRLRLIRYVLDMYIKAIPKDYFTVGLAREYHALRQYCSTIRTLPPLVRSVEKDEMLFHTFTLFKKRKYNRILTEVQVLRDRSVSIDPSILELALLSALRLKKIDMIVHYYALLAQKSPDLAAYFNPNVMPIIQRNNAGKKLHGSDPRLISTIWKNPTFFDRPVNKLAKRVSGSPGKQED